MGEQIVKSSVARVELGRPGPPIGASRMSAIKRCMGIKGHYVPLNKVRQWLADNPDFTERQVYHRKGCTCAECRKTGRPRAWKPGRKSRSSESVGALA